MHVEIWSDVACPFCYIGKSHFMKGLEAYGGKEDVTISYRTFQLDPFQKKNDLNPVSVTLAAKYGMSVDQAKAQLAQTEQMAANTGLEYHMDQIKQTNTEDALRLAYFAETKGLMGEMFDRLFQAYFTEGLNVGDFDVLVSLAEEVGLNGEEARQALESGEFADKIVSDREFAQQAGITGVPFFVVNNKYGISGAQPIETFTQALAQIGAEAE